MEDVIYFSKIEYEEIITGSDISRIIFLNIPEKELSFQVLK